MTSARCHEDRMNGEKPSLPHGWIVKQSGSYPDRVFYFNIHTGVSTWNMPQLVTPNAASKSSRHARGAKVKTPHSPHSKFSSNDDSDSSISYSDSEQNDPKNEPVFSQFQKEIFDEVITNSPSQHRDDVDVKLPKEPCTPGKELASSSTGKPENAGSNLDRKPPLKVKWDLEGGEVVYKGEGVEFPHVSVKKEKNDPGSFSNISEVLSKIRKDVENSECDLRSKLTVNREKRDVDPDKKRKKKDGASENVDCSTGTNVTKSNFDLGFVSKVVHLSQKDEKKEKTATPVTKQGQGQISKIVKKASEKLATPGGKGIWTRKRKISAESTSDEVPVKYGKSHLKPDLSLEICVGEKRKVILSPTRAVVARTPSSESLDLTCITPPLENTLSAYQITSSPPALSSDLASRLKGPVKISDQEVVLSRPGKARYRKVSMVTDSDVRKVVSSDSQSEANTNNSGVGDQVEPHKPLQADRLGRIQAWVDDIDDNSASQSQAPPVVLSPSQVQQRALPEHRQDEGEFCDMEVDEESDIEQMIIDLQEVRGELQFCPSQPVCDLSIPPSVLPPSQSSSQTLYLIIDTSSLMNHLKSLSDLRDDQIEGYGLPVLVIPWVVLQELDALKDNRSRQSFSLNSQNRAHKAVKYINACFTGRHPRVVGQSPKEAREVIEDLTIECNDDRVLQCCLQYKAKFPSSTIVMLSEDVNLRSKARVSGLEASSAKNLSEVLANSEQDLHRSDESQGQDVGGSSTTLEKPGVAAVSVAPQTPAASSPASRPVRSTAPVTRSSSSHVKLQRSQLDRVIVKIKGEIKDTLGLALEREMRAAFGNIWKNIVYRKPPWAARDIMESFKKHWIAVFGMILPRCTAPVVDSIVSKLQLNKVPLLSVQEITELVQDILRLMNSLKEHSSYDDKVDKSISKLQTILSDLQNGNISQSAVSPPIQSSAISTNTRQQSLQSHQTIPQTSKKNSNLANNRQSVHSNQTIPQAPVKNSNQIQSHPNSKSKVQCTTSQASSSKSSAIPSTSGSSISSSQGTKVKVMLASAPAKANTKTSSSAEDFELVQNCFQTVWANIHNVCVQIEMNLVHAISNEDISLLNRLIPLIKDLRFEFAMCLSISPYEIYNERKKFDDLCDQLNSFFLKLKHQPVEMQPVGTDALLAYFRSTDKRPTLQIGLKQLDDIITNLYELVKDLPD